MGDLTVSGPCRAIVPLVEFKGLLWPLAAGLGFGLWLGFARLVGWLLAGRPM